MSPSTADLAVTWWGHATTTVEVGGIRIATDPVLVDRLFHLRRYGVTPRVEACEADLVLLSHEVGARSATLDLIGLGGEVGIGDAE